MGRSTDIYFAIAEYVQAHRRDGLDIDLNEAATRIAMVVGPCGMLIAHIEELIARSAENAGVAVYVIRRSPPPQVRPMSN